MFALSSFAKSPTNVYFESQERGERVVFLLRKHFITNVPWIIFSLLLFLFPSISENISGNGFLAFIPERYSFTASAFWYLVVFMFALENYLVWYFNVYLITNKRVVDIDFFGLLHKRVSEAPLRNIEDATYSIGGVFQILFKYGDVIVQTAAEKREFKFESIPHPDLVHDKLTDLVTGVTRKYNHADLRRRKEEIK